MKIRPYFLMLPLLIFSCKKETYNPPPPYNPNKTISYTIIDNQTQLPVDSAYVNFAYGNNFSETGYSDANGRISFTIPTDWVINEVLITKSNYCDYFNNYNAVDIQLDQTILFNHYAYLRIHVENVAPANSSDKIEIGIPKPAWLTTYTPDVFYGAVNTTYITTALAGNIGVMSNIFYGSTFDHSFQTVVNTIGGDTTDITINF
jgi:hypothetical protein